MHLNKLLEQLKRNPAIMQIFDDDENHFDEDLAKEAVAGMRNEDGSSGPRWSVEESTAIANQVGMNLKSEKHNKWDWYVALNMMYSDYYKAVKAIAGGISTRYFAELAKAWLCDKDVPVGKMKRYYTYVMCNEPEYEDEEYEEERPKRRNTSVKYY